VASFCGKFSDAIKDRQNSPAQKLPLSPKPVWDTIGDARSELKLGYRKGASGGAGVGKLITDGARVEATLAGPCPPSLRFLARLADTNPFQMLQSSSSAALTKRSPK
jgi:hypothetical protein